jgi:hypothetical protein
MSTTAKHGQRAVRNTSKDQFFHSGWNMTSSSPVAVYGLASVSDVGEMSVGCSGVVWAMGLLLLESWCNKRKWNHYGMVDSIGRGELQKQRFPALLESRTQKLHHSVQTFAWC